MSLRTYLFGLGALVGLCMTILTVNSCFSALDPLHCKSNADCQAGQICALTSAQAGASGHINTCVVDGDAGPQPDAACEGMCCSNSPAPIPDGSGSCTACTPGGADCGIYPGASICQDDGSCAGCESDMECGVICGPDTPCSCRVDKTCGECRINEDCDSGICDKASGRCEPEGIIAYVTDSGSDDGDCGSKANKCRTVQRALERNVTNWVHIAAGEYFESVTISGGVSKKIVGEAKIVAGGKREIGVRFRPNAAVNQTVWHVTGTGTNVTIQGIAVEEASGAGNANIKCETNAVLYVQRAEMKNATDGANGIAIASGCSLTLERSRVSGNSGGGLDIRSMAPMRITNSIVVGNGSESSLMGGVLLASVQSALLDFNTIADNQSRVGAVKGIDCSAEVTARYNIVQNAAVDQDVSAACKIDGDETLPSYSLIGRNVPLEPTTYRLLPGSSELAIDKVDDPMGVTEDFDGDPRPHPADGKADIGADELIP